MMKLALLLVILTITGIDCQLEAEAQQIRAQATNIVMEMLGGSLGARSTSNGLDTDSVFVQKAISRMEQQLNKQASRQRWFKSGTRRLLAHDATTTASMDQNELKTESYEAFASGTQGEANYRRKMLQNYNAKCALRPDTSFDVTTQQAIKSSVLNISSPSACCDACAKRIDCYAWTVKPVSSGLPGCYLRGKSYTTTYQTGYTSGTLNEEYWFKGPPYPSPQPLQTGTAKYGEVLKLTYRYLDAQRSGNFPVSTRVPWRKPSHKNDAIPGGWYDAGDMLKISFPMSTAITFLSWGLVDFKSAYIKANFLDTAKKSLDWGVKYLMNCYDQEAQTFVGQIGHPKIDHAYWGRPEEQVTSRPVFMYDSSTRASDLLGSAASALASASMVYRYKNPAYADKLLDAAKKLYSWAKSNTGDYNDYHKDAVVSIYPSSDFYDDLSFAAGWIFRADGKKNMQYLRDAEMFWKRSVGMNEDYADINPGWDSLWVPTAVLMRNLARSGVSVPGMSMYNAVYDVDFYPAWTKANGNYDIVKTPKGMIYPRWNEWANLQFSTTTAMLMLLDAKTNPNPTQKANEIKYARSQVDYALGSGGRSFVVGWGKNPPLSAHHSAASCAQPPALCNNQTYWGRAVNAQVLTGALVGGPSGIRRHPENPDTYQDLRPLYISGEPSLNYNSGFTTALAGLYNLLPSYA